MRTALATFVVGVALAATAGAQQLVHDVPHRGAHVYNRTTGAFDVAAPPSRTRAEWVVGDGAAATPHEWLHFACAEAAVPAAFEQPAFDDSAWTPARGEFGTDVGANPEQRTDWRTKVLCLRTRVPLGSKKPKALWFVVDHDDGVRIWLNGRLVVADDGFGRGRSYVALGAALDAWQPGVNVIAAKCVNGQGAQHFDLGVAVLPALPANVRTAEDVLGLVRTEREQAERARSDLFGAYRPPPLLLHGELDPRRQCVAIPPGDLRELAGFVAHDLRCGRLGGPVEVDAWRMFRLGDLLVRGRAGAVDAAGWQTIEATVRSTPEPAPRGDSRRFVDRFVRPHVLYGFDGTLRIRRRLEIADGKARVAAFTTELDGRLLRGKDGKEVAATVRQREEWSFLRTHENQDAAFRTAVGDALARGTKRLRAQLQDVRGAGLEPQAEDAENSFHGGRLAIGLLALVKGGVPKDDDVVQRCVQELRGRKLIDTYSLANAIMAIEALHAPPNEAADLRTGTLDRPRKRQLPSADAALVQHWTAQLLQNLDLRVDRTQLLRFNYTAGDRFDNSVNQYGLLGLFSAHLCGVAQPQGVWEAAAAHLLSSQASQGGKVELDLVDYRTLARRQAAPEAATTASRTFAQANGWSYHEPKSDGENAPTWGSMTCAGITGLAICEAALAELPPGKRVKLSAECRRAREDGFAWLAQWMTPRQHPGAIERQNQWFYYWLYSLERAALLSGVALIQDRDWYFEGALVLVLAQQPDGSWPAELLWDQGVERNAMAILFLRQSTPPVLTGR
jgi:hypothetical protein